MERPVGVTVIAVLYWFGTFVLACMGLLSIVAAGVLATFLRKNNMEMLAGIGIVLAVVFFFLSALTGVLGWGLWSLKNWARVIVIVICGLGLIGAAMGLVVGITAHLFPLLSLIMVRVAINGAILWYLLQPEAKQAFGATSF